MQTLIHADIFFFITSIAVVVLSVFFAVALFYTILILRDLRQLSGLVRKGGETLASDVTEIRSAILGGGTRVLSVFDYFFDLFTHRRKQKTSAKKKVHE